MKYLCECGKEFLNSQSFNGHKSHCKIHLTITGKLDEHLARDKIVGKKIHEKAIIDRKAKQEQAKLIWLTELHFCETCSKLMLEKWGSGRFCCQSCANTHKHSSATRYKISASLLKSSAVSDQIASKKQQNELNYLLNPNYCTICNALLSYSIRHNKTCGNPACLSEAYRQAGLKSVLKQADIRRSKNEIMFYTLCVNYFNAVEHNVGKFNGWDADIIIEDYKIAVLWNGIWHYKKVKNQQSVDQIQTRDKIKYENIISWGYTPYIIKDLGKYNPKFVLAEFEKFKLYISSMQA